MDAVSLNSRLTWVLGTNVKMSVYRTCTDVQYHLHSFSVDKKESVVSNLTIS